MKFIQFTLSIVNVLLQAFSIQLLWNAWLLPDHPITMLQAITAPFIYSLATIKSVDILVIKPVVSETTEGDRLTASVTFTVLYLFVIAFFYIVKAFM